MTDFKALLNDPTRELERICEFVAIEVSEDVTGRCAPCATSSRSRTATAGEVPSELSELLPRTEKLAERSRELLARPIKPPRTAKWSAPADSPLPAPTRRAFRSSSTAWQLAARLDLPDREADLRPPRPRPLNTHFRNFTRPMGLAVAPGQIKMGTRAEVLDYRNFPEVASKVEPQGKHDACFVPRNRHFTGDIRIHEVAFAQGELWIVATNFSCLATLDAQHSFRPTLDAALHHRASAPQDRCHLNGLCVVEDDRVRYVTALGETNEPGGWREDKAGGGILIDVKSARRSSPASRCPTHRAGWTAGSGCSSRGRGPCPWPTSTPAPWRRWPSSPASREVFIFAGGLAFVGLSQVRETATFGGLPLMERLDERLCGVWAVNPQSRGGPPASSASRSWSRRSSTWRCCPGCATRRSPRRAPTRPHSFVLPEAQPAAG